MPFGRRKRWAPPDPLCVLAAAVPATPVTPPPGYGVERVLAPGDSARLSKGDAIWELEVEAGVPPAPPADADAHLGVDAELRTALAAAVATARLRLERCGGTTADCVLATVELGDELAAANAGVVADPVAQRFYRPGGWRVEEPLGRIDAREHVTVHAVTNGETWVHTHGLLKFGRPEVEAFVPPDLGGALGWGLLDLATYVIGGAVIAPDETVGAPDAPIRVAAASRDLAHWGDVPALELVGTADAFRAWLADYL